MDFDEWRLKWFQAAEERGHALKRDEDGRIDEFVCSGGYHNGPGCTKCGESWCMHCKADVTKIPVCSK